MQFQIFLHCFKLTINTNVYTQYYDTMYIILAQQYHKHLIAFPGLFAFTNRSKSDFF